MLEIALIVLTVGLTLAGERLASAPRDIRRNDEQIVNRDEDLSTWIEDEAQVLRRETIKVNLQKRPPRYAYLAEFEAKQLRDQLLHRYRDQLRDAERVVRGVRASEQSPHRVLRYLRRNPIPDLSAPVEHAEIIERWVSPPKDATRINFAKLIADSRKQRESFFRPAASAVGNRAVTRP